MVVIAACCIVVPYVPLSTVQILDNNAFSLDRALEVDPQFLDNAHDSDAGALPGAAAVASAGARGVAAAPGAGVRAHDTADLAAQNAARDVAAAATAAVQPSEQQGAPATTEQPLNTAPDAAAESVLGSKRSAGSAGLPHHEADAQRKHRLRRHAGAVDTAAERPQALDRPHAEAQGGSGDSEPDMGPLRPPRRAQV